MRATIAICLAYLAGCGGGMSGSDAGSDGGRAGDAGDCTVTVQPGTDDRAAIQAAFVNAPMTGAVICLGAGTFRPSDVINATGKTNFTLRGAGMGTGGTTIDLSTSTGAQGFLFMTMTNVVIEDLALRDSIGNALEIRASDGVTIRRVSAGWTTVPRMPVTGKYGLYPVSSRNVLIEDSEVFGSADAGFYIGQATNCIMRRNNAHDNVAGMEVENSTNCDVYENDAHDNTGGILVFELPDLPLLGSGTLVHDNMVRNNNLANFGMSGEIISLLPAGTGIFLLAAHEVEVRNNTITGNQGTGIGIISWSTAEALGGGGGRPPVTGYNPWATHLNIHDNMFSANGAMPLEHAGDALFLVASSVMVTTLEDIIWDGTVDTGAMPNDALCIRANGTATFRDIDVDGNFMMSTTGLMAGGNHDCTLPARPAVQF
jgi:parallel beta-helix repeat protein